MKKIISLILALVLVISLGFVVCATDTASGIGEYAANVTGSYVPGTTSGATLFSVEIQWEDLEFTYHAELAGEWDAENHVYLPNTPAYWEGKGKITVTNHSNAKISATPKYTAAQGYADAAMTFSPAALNIASAENGNAQIGTMTVTPDGSLPEMDQPGIIGSITLTIAQDTTLTAEEFVAEVEALIERSDELKQQITADQMSAMGSTYTNFNKYHANLSTSLKNYKSGEITRENLNTAYEKLLASYNAVLELM